jgi:hypothetical protein
MLTEYGHIVVFSEVRVDAETGPLTLLVTCPLVHPVYFRLLVENEV